jgi:DNA polymerase III delta prime subunit
MEIFGNLEAQNQLIKILLESPTKVVALTGQRGLGKFSFSKDFVTSNFSNSDIFISDTSINEIKNALEFSKFSPLESETRIILINDVDKLSLPAQDACLKTFEDMSSESIFILICHDTGLLSSAFSSRIRKEIKWSILDKDEIFKFASKSVVDDFSINVCDGRPGLYEIVYGDERLRNFFVILRKLITNKPSRVEMPEAISFCKKTYAPYREAIAHICSKAVKSLDFKPEFSDNIEKVLLFASSLIKTNASIESHWVSLVCDLM